MAKKELLKEDLPPLPAGAGEEGFAKPKMANFLNKSFAVTKFIFGICLLPFVYSVAVSFMNELSVIDKPMQVHFWQGVIAFLLVYLFVWDAAILYTKGQKVLEAIFTFFKPLLKVAPFLLPIYTIILFVLYWVLSFFTTGLLKYFIFLFGSTIALHLIFSAKTMRSRKEDFLKGNYIFGFSFIFILNLMLVGFCLNILFDKYSFVRFVNSSYQIAQDIFQAVFKQLFVT